MDQRRKTDRKLNRESGIRFLEKERSFHGRETFVRIFLIMGLSLMASIRIFSDTIARISLTREEVLRMGLLLLFAVLADLLYEWKYLRIAARSLYLLLLGWIIYRLWHMEELLGEGLTELQEHLIQAYRAYGMNENYSGSLQGAGLTVFLILCLFLILAAYEFFYHLRLRELFFLPVIMTFCLGLVLGRAPGAAAVVCFTMMLWLMYGLPWRDEWTGQREFYSGRERSLQKYAGILQKALSAALVAASLMAGLMLFRGGREQILSYYDKVQQFQWDMEDAAADAWKKMVAAFRSKQMDHSLDNQIPEYTNQEVFTLRSASRPDNPVYLCSFEAEKLEKGEWKSAGREFAAACREFGIGEQEARETLLVSLNIRLRYDIQEKGFMNSLHKYTLTYAGDGLHDMLYAYYLYPKKDQLEQMTGDGLGSSPARVTDSVMETADPLSDYWWMSSQKQTGEAYGSQDFWEWYNAYALQVGTESVASDLSKEWIRDTLAVDKYRDQLASEDLATRNHARYTAAGNVAAYLKEHFRYSWNLDKLPAGSDAVGYFLTQGKAGYCMHFASAGVTILREMGIPARFASGYIVMPESMQTIDRSSYEVSVPDSNAHAWVEVFYDNVGWIPVEMTPGYGDNAQLPTDPEAVRQREEREQQEEVTGQTEDDGDGSESGEESENGSSSETEQTSEKADNPEKGEGTGSDATEAELITCQGSGADGTAGSGSNAAGSKGGFAKGLVRALKLILLLAAIGGGIYGASAALRYRIQRIREQLLQDLNHRRYRRAVLRINRMIYRKLQLRSRKPQNNISDAEYEKLLIEHFPQVTAEEWQQYMRIAKKVAFSRLSPTEEEAKLCRQIYEKTGLSANRK